MPDQNTPLLNTLLNYYWSGEDIRRRGGAAPVKLKEKHAEIASVVQSMLTGEYKELNKRPAWYKRFLTRIISGTEL